MSRMGDELEKRLDANKYELLDICRRVNERLKASLAPNPEIDGAEIHVNYLYGVLTCCIGELDKILESIRNG